MQVFLWFLCELCYLSSATIVASAIYQDASKVDILVVNSSRLETIDPRFNIDAAFEGPRLPLISVLVSIVELLVNLGLQDFSGRAGLESWKLKEYPEVQIVILPDVEGGYIERRFVIWGLSQLAGLMINSRRFQTAILTLKWNGEKAGSIMLSKWPPNLDISEPSSVNSTQVSSKVVNSAIAQSAARASRFPKNASITVDAYDEHFSVEASLHGLTLDLFDVFRMVIAILVDAAENGASQRIMEYSSPTSLAGVEIAISTPDPAPTHPPFFETQWLLRLMASIPEYMIKNGVFMEAAIVVKVDGVTVANAVVTKKLSVVGSPLNSAHALVS